MNQDEAEKMLREAYEKITNLINGEKWVEAHRACLEILRFDPENIKIIRLKNKIENQVRKINVRAIREDLNNLKPLWQQGKYEDLLHNLQKLEKYAGDYQPLKKFIARAEKAYRKQMQADQENYYQQQIISIKQSIAGKKYDQAEKEAQQLKKLLIHQKDLEIILRNLHSSWIESELEKNEELIKSNKFEDTLLFLHGLRRIDDRSARVKSLMEATNRRYKMFKIEEKRDLIFKTFEEIKTLMQLKKYENAKDKAAEILEIDPVNEKAKKLFKQAKRQVDKITDREIIKQMKAARKQLKKEYKTDKKGFIKI